MEPIMSILSMRSDFLLPEKERILNKNMTVQQKPFLIASITEEGGVIKLWVFHQAPDLPCPTGREGDFVKCVTNRDDIVNRTMQIHSDFNDISEITIQGIPLHFTHLSSSRIRYEPKAFIKLQHFLEAGVDFSSIENVDIDDLILSEYQLAEEIGFPAIDTLCHMPVSLKLKGKSSQVLIDPPHLFNLKVGKHDETHSFVDSSDGKEIKYHISELMCYDIWTKTMNQIEEDDVLSKLKEQGHDDVSIEKMKIDMQNSIRKTCPEGHVLLLLIYECSENFQLNFYTTEFLLAEPVNKGHSWSLFHLKNEKGKFGNQLRSCFLKTVPVGFNDTVEVELMSWYKVTPDVSIDAI